MFDILKKYTNKRGVFRATVSDVRTFYYHPHIANTQGGALLLLDLESVNDNAYVAKYYWVNSYVFDKYYLEPGDRIEFTAYSKLYMFGRDRYTLNAYRVIRDYYRLLYAKDIEVIEPINTDITDVLGIYSSPLLEPVRDLITGAEYKDFKEYVKNNPLLKHEEAIELYKIMLFDCHYPELILNRKGQVNCQLFSPRVMFVDDYNRLTDSQRIEIDKIKSRKFEWVSKSRHLSIYYLDSI